MARFEKFMEKLSEFDFENFEEIRDDLLWMEAKTGKKSKRLEVENVRQYLENVNFYSFTDLVARFGILDARRRR